MVLTWSRMITISKDLTSVEKALTDADVGVIVASYMTSELLDLEFEYLREAEDRACDNNPAMPPEEVVEPHETWTTHQKALQML